MTIVDLSNYSHTVGKMARLHCVNVLPVLAGDSIEYEMLSKVEFKPFTRGVVIDAVVDVVTCFVPHRHVYGQTWIDFVREGRDTNITLPTRATDTIIAYVPWVDRTNSLPAWLVDPFWRVWSRYFRPPNQAVSEQLTLPLTHDVENKRFGPKCPGLPSIWNSGVDTQPTDAQRQLDVSSDIVDMIEVDQKRNEYANQLDRDWSGNYYTDLLKTAWGGRAGTDADERPTMLMHTRQSTSGYNVHGTSAGNLAETAGKGHAIINHKIPRRFFGEHGTILTVMVVRFPNIHEQEVHYLSKIGSPSYKEIAGDPRVLSAHPPVRHQVKDFFASSSTADLFYQPYGMWNYQQPPHISNVIRDLQAYPYLEIIPSDKVDAALTRNGDYDEIFLSGAQMHYESQNEMTVTAERAIPTPMQAAYVGAP